MNQVSNLETQIQIFREEAKIDEEDARDAETKMGINVQCVRSNAIGPMLWSFVWSCGATRSVDTVDTEHIPPLDDRLKYSVHKLTPSSDPVDMSKFLANVLDGSPEMETFTSIVRNLVHLGLKKKKDEKNGHIA